MNSLKTLLGATLLAALAYGVYVGITKKPGAKSESARIEAPRVELGKSTSSLSKPMDSASDNAADAAPPFDAGHTEAAAPAPFAETAKNAWEQETAAPPARVPLDDEPPLPVVTEAPAMEQENPPPRVADAPADPAANSTPAAGAPAATGASLFQTEMVKIEQQLAAGQLAEAHLALSQFYGSPELTPQEHQHVVELLSQLAGTVVYSQQHLLAPPHVVVQGETLEQIAANCNVPWQLLAKINGLAGPGPVQPGQQLKIVNGPFHAYVDLEDRQLVLFLDGKYYAGRFPVAFGKETEPQPGPTPHLVKNKLEHPTYFLPDGTSFGPDDPKNPLGTRKIELDGQLCIHGTNDPTSLDRDDPHGCIRMSPRDVEDVYDILTVGSQVVIQR